ncbi:MAG: hypothetical protein KGL39_30075 [Patescibacteria group bacterium]|nr:hypothetical protein [Patescibacteria group bacterium]
MEDTVDVSILGVEVRELRRRADESDRRHDWAQKHIEDLGQAIIEAENRSAARHEKAMSDFRGEMNMRLDKQDNYLETLTQRAQRESEREEDHQDARSLQTRGIVLGTLGTLGISLIATTIAHFLMAKP